MSALAIGLVAVAAVLHVTWNVLLKTAGDPLRASAVGMAAAAAVVAPIAAAAWQLLGRPPVPPAAVGLALVSGGVEVVFFVLLSAAYRRGDLSVVYPIARGTAPLLAVLAGVGLLGERLTALGWLGVGLLLAGLLAVQRPWRFLRSAGARAPDPAVPFALATGVAIATYSALDRVAVQLVAPWLYAGMLWPVMAVGLVAVVALRDARSPAPAGRIDAPRAAAGGVLTLAAYLLVLGAMSMAPLAVVAPLRESAIVLASGWGLLRLREASSRHEAALRLGAAVLVVVGAATLALGG